METIVLLSGGIDSAACVAFYSQLGYSVAGVFVDYGQPACEAEEKSAAAIATHYKVPLTVIRCSGAQTSFAGEIPGRNAFLLFTALLFRPIESGIIALGIHHGTRYYDCSESFTTDLKKIIGGYFDGQVALGVPFLNWNKPMIYEYATQTRVPVELTWSCEVGSVIVCGECLSCRDRERLNVQSSI